MSKLSRRGWLQATGLASIAGGLAAGRTAAAQHETARSAAGHPSAHDNHAMGTVGRVARESPDPRDPASYVDPSAYLRSWNFSELPPDLRARFYQETPRPDGTLFR